jgi:hypothetical protein
MGGAFVAMADDSTTSWWNPAGPAAGPFFDVGAGRASGSAWVAAAIPPLGLGYYQFAVARDPTAGPSAGRQEGSAEVPMRASHVGATLVQTLVDGVHVGMTVKYVRGGADDGRTAGTGDLDAGVLAVLGAFRVGAAVRNLRAPVLEGALVDRQIRIGAAVDAGAAGYAPATVSIDADLRAYMAPGGRRRVVAAGAERWLRERRIGLRGGARLNTAGARGKVVTGGISVAIRPGLYVEGHAAAGSDDERGWGAAARISF